MKDLIERLRKEAGGYWYSSSGEPTAPPAMREAADALERLTAENAAFQKRIENCVMELDRRASALRSVSDERDALRKVVKGFLDDYASADGMYDMKHYAREFHAAMEQSHE